MSLTVTASDTCHLQISDNFLNQVHHRSNRKAWSGNLDIFDCNSVHLIIVNHWLYASCSNSSLSGHSVHSFYNRNRIATVFYAWVRYLQVKRQSMTASGTNKSSHVQHLHNYIALISVLVSVIGSQIHIWAKTLIPPGGAAVCMVMYFFLLPFALLACIIKEKQNLIFNCIQHIIIHWSLSMYCIPGTMQFCCKVNTEFYHSQNSTVIMPFSVRGQDMKESPGWNVCGCFSMLFFTPVNHESMVFRSLKLQYGVRGQAAVNAVLNCLSLEICPHWDTWERWKGHTASNGLKEVDESLHARPVNMSTVLTSTSLSISVITYWILQAVLSSIVVFFSCLCLILSKRVK